VRTTRNIIIRLPILRCKPLQPKGIVPVLVLLRMTDSDSDIHSRRPLFWVPVDGRSFGTPPGPRLPLWRTVNWRRASKTELHGVIQLLGSAGNHRCNVSCPPQQRCTASCETFSDKSWERWRKHTYIFMGLSRAVYSRTTGVMISPPRCPK
jgi:hypothetical protein